MYRFNEYRAAVLRDYEERKTACSLSHELTHPTAANLRREAVNACESRFKGSDEKLLASFFQQREDYTEYARVIRRGGVNSFRALSNLLNGEVAEPGERQIELLAWLTDFTPRPYQEYLRLYPVPIDIAGPVEPEDIPTAVGDDHIGTREDMIVEPPKEKQTGLSVLTYPWYVIGLSAMLLLVVALAVIYRPFDVGKCIRWDGKQYEVVTCDAFPGDPSVIPYDRVKLNDFKLVLRYDTLTTYSLGKVWYAKRKDEYEFFTAAGVHPVYRDVQLKPLSDFILNTVVRKKKAQLLLNGH
ncbi:hypothetical protein [Mucilaginibacter sp. SG564]|uniref:hypothetical protein n=1 Tax=Mucilaginibacter sp. SG564 TaxID=2587022 RepID=UPI001557DAE2|nr:hypothetical protein [Mucilaginibacter sp. SG564]NOW98952.1 hypothetical protein [Mucilaginibacter sp. SG564]